MIVAIARVCDSRIGLSTLTGNSVDDEIRCLYDGTHSIVSVCLSVCPSVQDHIFATTRPNFCPCYLSPVL